MIEYANNIPGIRTPKEDQLGVQMRYLENSIWMPPFAYSYKESYLKSKMKEHRYKMVQAGITDAVEYRIINREGKEYFTYTYKPNEYEVVKKRPSQSKYKVNFKRITDEKDPAGYYYVIVDGEDKCITNIELLRYLRTAVWMDRIEMPNHLKPLAYISTYIPKYIDDFRLVYGFGEKLIEKYGEYFLNKIEEFKELENEQR